MAIAQTVDSVAHLYQGRPAGVLILEYQALQSGITVERDLGFVEGPLGSRTTRPGEGWTSTGLYLDTDAADELVARAGYERSERWRQIGLGPFIVDYEAYDLTFGRVPVPEGWRLAPASRQAWAAAIVHRPD